MAVSVRFAWILALSVAGMSAVAATSPVHAATRALPQWLPDGARYTDVDLSAYGLPEGFMRTSPYARATPLLPVRQLAFRGWLAASEHRTEAAHINFHRALRITPNDRHLLWAYGWAQLNLDRPAQALAAFRRNLALRPEQRPLWLPMALALTYTAAGDAASARAWYREAALSDPTHWGSDGIALRSTLHWTSRERVLLRRLIADRGAASPAITRQGPGPLAP